jgi:3-phenylpropionate/cinnamic acid dioxygenase small subunit
MTRFESDPRIADMQFLREVEELLYQETSLLDRPDLDAWIQLYTEDGTYWMPAILDQPDPLNHISLMYDDRVMMEIRRRNFVHPRAASKDYKVRASHLISNIRIVARDESTGDCTVTSNFHCASYYWDKQTLFAGAYRHELVRTPAGLRIRHKRVDLINCDGVLGTIIIYL